MLTAKGADVQLRLYTRRAHVVSDDEIVEARAFLESWLASNILGHRRPSRFPPPRKPGRGR
ncbi:MAG: hypothetical protein DMF98_03285 [Acidobacteria bacterium]|nr:MAG: hypothetical protein DMF98_03285 [Acidobacteriota bacterium]